MSINEISSQTQQGMDVFTHYLGALRVGVHYKSPFGHEGRPSFNLFVRRDGLVCFCDHAVMADNGEALTGSAYDFVMHWHNVDFKEAVGIIKRDVLGLTGRDLESGVSSHSSPRPQFKTLPSQSNLQHQLETVHIRAFPREWEAADLAFFARTGIELPTLQKYHCYPLTSYHFAKGDKHFTITAKLDDPMYGYHFPATDHWKIYRPFTADKRFRWISNVVGGVDVFGWDALPARAHKLYLCAGQRDTMALHQLTGLPCLALNSETAKLTPELHQLLLCVADEVYCCLDNDKTGIAAQQKLRYEWGIYDAGHELLQGADCNDLSELLEAHGSEKERQELAAHFRDFSVHKSVVSFH